MLVITGEKDFRIPYTQGIASFTALQRRDIPSRLLVFPDENHWVLKPKNSIQWYGEVLGWLEPLDMGKAAQLRGGCRQRSMAANRRRMTELAKTFEPGPIEARWYAHWEEQGAVPPGAARCRAVHHRHAAAQRHRLAAHRPCARQHVAGHLDPPRADAGQGRLWVVGTDHAGIATQMVVERKLDERRDKRTEITAARSSSRKVWEWKAESGGADHPASFAASAPAATGPTSASPWTRASRPR